MQVVQQETLLDGLAQRLSENVARIARLISRQLVNCRPDQGVHVAAGDRLAPLCIHAFGRVLHRQDQIHSDDAL